MAELSKLGRYELRRVLGKGAMGVVYEGFDPVLSRKVAVKTILQSVALDDETERSYVERFAREAKAVARLNHPNIVQVHDFGVEHEVAYLVMEFIDGRELRGHLAAGERFATHECVRIMGELLDALDFAHEAGVIHRDVKPANVMLDMQRRVKLADFGVARIQDSERSAAGTMVGTPAFMSPEQISGGKVDRRTDIFSAGTLLYQMLTGEQPFKGEGAWTVAKQIMQDDPPRPSSIAATLPPVFDDIVDRALAKKPAERFANAREFAAALRGALAGEHLPQLAPKPQAAADAKASDTELEFWRSIQNRGDLEELELYVEQFPNGAYTRLARLKIAKLREPLEAERKAAEEKARLEAEEQARREEAEKARRDAEAKARREAEEKTRREAAEKAKRDAEERALWAQALKQQEVTARAKAATHADATVAIGQPPEPPAAAKKSHAVPAIAGVIVVAGGIAAYLMLGRAPAPPPVATAPAVVEKAAPPKPAPPAIDVEKIKREAEERVRKEFAEKAAAEKALAEKAAAAKAALEKLAAAKGAAEKLAAEKASEKAAAERAAAEKLAVAKAASAKLAAEKAAAESAAAERFAAEKAAAEKQAADKAAAEKAAAEKAAAAARASAAKPVESKSCGYSMIFKFSDGSKGCFDDFRVLRRMIAKNLPNDWSTMAVAATLDREGCQLTSWTAWNYRGTDGREAQQKCTTAAASRRQGCSCEVVYDSSYSPDRQKLLQSERAFGLACQRPENKNSNFCK